MKRTAVVAIAVAMLSGCAGPAWKISSATDAFTQRTSMMVTSGDYTAGNSILISPSKLYPVVRKEGEEIYVGLMSNSDIRIPIVTAQIWIDQNEAWTISSQETPIILALPSWELLLGLSPEVTKQAQAQGLNVHKIMGGYTVAGGDKAKAILKQMLTGRVLRFRTVGIDQTASPTREVVLDESLSQSLRSVGVDPRSF